MTPESRKSKFLYRRKFLLKRNVFLHARLSSVCGNIKWNGRNCNICGLTVLWKIQVGEYLIFWVVTVCEHEHIISFFALYFLHHFSPNFCSSSASVFPSMRTEKHIITFNQCPARNVMVCAPVSRHHIPSQSSSSKKIFQTFSMFFQYDISVGQNRTESPHN